MLAHVWRPARKDSQARACDALTGIKRAPIAREILAGGAALAANAARTGFEGRFVGHCAPIPPTKAPTMAKKARARRRAARLKSIR